jgi:hypothetical protein
MLSFPDSVIASSCVMTRVGSAILVGSKTGQPAKVSDSGPFESDMLGHIQEGTKRGDLVPKR